MMDFIISAAIAGAILYGIIYFRNKKVEKQKEKASEIPEAGASIDIQDIQTYNVTDRHKEMSSPGIVYGMEQDRIEVEQKEGIKLEEGYYIATVEEAIKYMRSQSDQLVVLRIPMERHVSHEGDIKTQNDIMSIMTNVALKNHWLPDGSKEDDRGRIFKYKRMS